MYYKYHIIIFKFIKKKKKNIMGYSKKSNKFH